MKAIDEELIVKVILAVELKVGRDWHVLGRLLVAPSIFHYYVVATQVSYHLLCR